MTSSSLIGWSPPISLWGHRLKPWPQEKVFPEPFNNFVCELARSTETPIELAALMMLTTVSTSVQKHYEVQVKLDYFEPVNIWCCVALPSGSRKSAVQQACIAPLVTWEKRRREEMEPARKKCESRNKTIKAQIKELRRNTGKLGEGDTLEKQINEISRLENEIMPLPTLPQLWTSDATPESLALLMEDNDGVMSILSDEGGIFDLLAGRYSGGIPNLDLVLKGHSGTSCRVNRVSKPPIFIEKAILSIGLSPQPEILESLAKQRVFRGRGLIARFLYALPLSNLGSRALDEPPMDAKVIDEYHSAINCLLMRKQEPSGKSNKERSKLRLSDDAAEEWRLYALVVELRLGAGGRYERIRDWGGKFPGAIARLAGLLHLMRYANNDTPENIPISKSDMRLAISIGSCLESHALAVFDLMGKDPCYLEAQRILDWMNKEQLQEFSQRACHYALKSHFRNVKELKPCLEVLIEHGYISEREPVKVSHRPSRVFIVNPYLYEDERSD